MLDSSSSSSSVLGLCLALQEIRDELRSFFASWPMYAFWRLSKEAKALRNGSWESLVFWKLIVATFAYFDASIETPTDDAFAGFPNL